MSKGSARRPRFVPLADLEAQWERTFPKREVKQMVEGGPITLSNGATLRTWYAGGPTGIALPYCQTPLPSAPDGEPSEA